MDNRKFLADRIRELRMSAHATAGAIGEMVGRSDKTVSAWENGTNQPSYEMLIELCNAFSTNISYFFPPEVSGGTSLTEDENRLLWLYRRADASGQRAIIGSAEALSNHFNNYSEPPFDEHGKLMPGYEMVDDPDSPDGYEIRLRK